MIGFQDEIMGCNKNIICTSLDSRNSMGDHSRIGTPGVNKDIFSPRSDTTSNLLSCMGSIEKFDTHVHGYETQERNLELSCIEEVGVKSIFPEIVKESNSSGQVKIANSILSESPKFISHKPGSSDLLNHATQGMLEVVSLLGLKIYLFNPGVPILL